jgi:hypothetical protein
LCICSCVKPILSGTALSKQPFQYSGNMDLSGGQQSFDHCHLGFSVFCFFMPFHNCLNHCKMVIKVIKEVVCLIIQITPFPCPFASSVTSSKLIALSGDVIQRRYNSKFSVRSAGSTCASRVLLSPWFSSSCLPPVSSSVPPSDGAGVVDHDLDALLGVENGSKLVVAMVVVVVVGCWQLQWELPPNPGMWPKRLGCHTRVELKSLPLGQLLTKSLSLNSAPFKQAEPLLKSSQKTANAPPLW